MSDRFDSDDDRFNPSLGERSELFEGMANQIQAFLLALVQDPEDLARYVKNRVAYLEQVPREKLSDEAKALLLESDYSVVYEVMRHRNTQAIRWLCVWII